MKRMAISGVCAALFFLGSSLAFAQQGGGMGGGMSADAMAQKMQKKLNLTQDQVNQIKPILEENMAKRQQLKGSMQGGGDRSAMFKQMKQMQEEQNQKLSKVLTPEQMQQWTAAKTDMRQRFMQRKRGGQGQDMGMGE